MDEITPGWIEEPLSFEDEDFDLEDDEELE